MCGVIGISSPGEEAAPLAALGLFALQHRGQESAGLAVSDGRQVMVYKDLGLVAQVLDERRLPSLWATWRSPTAAIRRPARRAGRTRSLPSGLARDATVAMGHNGNLVNTRQLLELLPGGRDRLAGSTDTELLTALLAEEPGDDLIAALLRLLPRVAGAYSLVVMDEQRLDRRARSARFSAARAG